MNKVTTKVTDANGGMHNAREFLKAKKMLMDNTYINARLYHLCFLGSEQLRPYQDSLKALCAELRRHQMPCQWKACVEDDEERGFHMHIFLLVEAKFSNPDNFLNRKLDGWLTTMVTKNGITFNLNPPRDPLHLGEHGKKKNYATLPKTKPEKLENCIEWISYLYKVRSKQDMQTTYFSSRQSRENNGAKAPM